MAEASAPAARQAGRQAARPTCQVGASRDVCEAVELQPQHAPGALSQECREGAADHLAVRRVELHCTGRLLEQRLQQLHHAAGGKRTRLQVQAGEARQVLLAALHRGGRQRARGCGVDEELAQRRGGRQQGVKQVRQAGQPMHIVQGPAGHGRWFGSARRPARVSAVGVGGRRRRPAWPGEDGSAALQGATAGDACERWQPAEGGSQRVHRLVRPWPRPLLLIVVFVPSLALLWPPAQRFVLHPTNLGGALQELQGRGRQARADGWGAVAGLCPALQRGALALAGAPQRAAPACRSQQGALLAVRFAGCSVPSSNPRRSRARALSDQASAKKVRSVRRPPKSAGDGGSNWDSS